MARGVGLVAPGQYQHVLLGADDERAIEPRQPLLADLVAELGKALELGLRSKLQGDKVLGAGADAVADVVAGHYEVPPLRVTAAHDDMSVRMASVEVIDRDPIERGP